MATIHCALAYAYLSLCSCLVLAVPFITIVDWFGIAMLLTIDSITLATLYGMYHKGGRFSGYFIIQTITILLVNFFHFMTSCVNPGIATEQEYPATNQYCW